jgi:hypothetical protein
MKFPRMKAKRYVFHMYIQNGLAYNHHRDKEWLQCNEACWKTLEIESWSRMALRRDLFHFGQHDSTFLKEVRKMQLPTLHYLQRRPISDHNCIRIADTWCNWHIKVQRFILLRYFTANLGQLSTVSEFEWSKERAICLRSRDEFIKL